MIIGNTQMIVSGSDRNGNGERSNFKKGKLQWILDGVGK